MNIDSYPFYRSSPSVLSSRSKQLPNGNSSLLDGRPPQLREAWLGVHGTQGWERVRDARLTADSLSVDLLDGRTITVPLAWYPRLLHATEPQRNNWQIAGGGFGIQWRYIDENLSTDGLLLGAPASRPSVSDARESGRFRRQFEWLERTTSL